MSAARDRKRSQHLCSPHVSYPNGVSPCLAILKPLLFRFRFTWSFTWSFTWGFTSVHLNSSTTSRENAGELQLLEMWNWPLSVVRPLSAAATCPVIRTRGCVGAVNVHSRAGTVSAGSKNRFSPKVHHACLLFKQKLDHKSGIIIDDLTWDDVPGHFTCRKNTLCTNLGFIIFGSSGYSF